MLKKLKIKKDGTVSHQGENTKGNGGARPGCGAKPSIEKLKDEARKLGWDQFKVEMAELGWDEVPGLLKDSNPSIRLETLKLMFAYAYGKPKDSLDVSSGGKTLQALINIIQPTSDGTIGNKL